MDRINQNKEKILLFSIIACYLATMIPITITYILLEEAYTSTEAYIGFTFMFFSTFAFLIGYYSVVKRKSMLYPISYLLFHLLTSLLITVINWMWFPVFIISILGLIVGFKCLKDRDRTFFPKLSLKTALVFGLMLISILPAGLSYIWIPKQEYTIEYPFETQQNVEISFTLANLTSFDTELYNIMNMSNSLEHINISCVGAFLEEFVLNTSLLIGEEFKPQGEWVKSREFYLANTSTEEEAWQQFSDANDAYNDYWNNWTGWIRSYVDNLTIEDILNDDTLYATECFYEDLINNLTSINVAFDLMPLLEREVYVNDYTIERLNKTILIMERWIELNNIPHRGIVIDTERMWGNDDETLMDYFNKDLHRQGIIKLGQLIRHLKEWQWDIKGFDTLFGEYTNQKWIDHALNPRKSMVAGATFGVHIHDLWDKDDAQQNLFKISILAEDNPNDDTIAPFDYVGIMTYENGENSEQAVYSYCVSGDYFFGKRNVPYIYSGLDNCDVFIGNEEDYIEGIYRKFKIAQNYGYDTIGIWAFTNIFCFREWGRGWCGGLYDFVNSDDLNATDLLYTKLMLRLENEFNESISIEANAGNYAIVTWAVNFLDIYLPGDFIYSQWPFGSSYENFTGRIRVDSFIIDTNEQIDNVLRILAIFIFFYLALRLFKLSEKSKKEKMDIKHSFLMCQSLFFFFTGLNFFFSELEIRFNVYPEIFPVLEVGDMFLITPMSSDIFLIIFFLLSALPMMYGLEKNFMKKERFPLTIIGLITLASMTVLLIWNALTGMNPVLFTYANIVILLGWIMMILCSLRVIFIYLSLAIKTSGEIRTLAIMMGIGFILLLSGTIITGSIESLGPLTGELFGRLIALIGVILLYLGGNKLQ